MRFSTFPLKAGFYSSCFPGVHISGSGSAGYPLSLLQTGHAGHPVRYGSVWPSTVQYISFGDICSSFPLVFGNFPAFGGVCPHAQSIHSSGGPGNAPVGSHLLFFLLLFVACHPVPHSVPDDPLPIFLGVPSFFAS